MASTRNRNTPGNYNLEQKNTGNLRTIHYTLTRNMERHIIPDFLVTV